MAKFNAAAAVGKDETFEIKNGSYAPTIMFLKGDPSVGATLAKATKTKPQDIEDVSYHGGFFITLDNCPKDANGDPVDLTKYGWREDSFVSRSGKGTEIQGYTRRELRIAACSMRQGFEAYSNGERVGIFPTYNDADKHGKVSGKIHVLAVVEGLEEFGPFIFTFSGHTQMAITGAKPYPGVFNQFRKAVIAAAEKVAPSTYPFRSFWMAVRSSADDNGAPRFISAGKGESATQIVVPEYSGQSIDAVDLDDVFVGEELKARFDEIAEDAKGWSQEWQSAQVNEGDTKEDFPFDDDEDTEDLI